MGLNDQIRALSRVRSKVVTMKLRVGKYKGHSVGWVLLNHPEYIEWIQSESDFKRRSMIKAHDEVPHLIRKFNARPFKLKCQGMLIEATPKRCPSSATRCTVYRDNVFLMKWWCDTCDPYQDGAGDGQLQIIRTFQDSVEHVRDCCNGHEKSFRHLVIELAKAKGLPDKAGESEVTEFFR